LRAVLDTSVLVAAFLHPAGVNGRVLALAGERYELCLSTAILAEVRKVLSYSRLRRYGYSEEEVEEFLRALREAAFLVRRWPKIQVVREDPADDHVLACALAAKAHYIVSKDEHLQKLREYQGIRILPTEAFLALITGEQTVNEPTNVM
jgi:putative PIN family toxin of toxin-antitoxin system